MTKRAFIAGISGQDGGYLAKFLLERGYTVHGGVHRRDEGALAQLRAFGTQDRVTFHDLDLTRDADLSRVLDKVGPDEIYNFAGPSSLAACYEDTGLSAEVIGLGPVRILDWLRRSGAPTRFYQASTSEIFRGGDAVMGLDENSELRPRTFTALASFLPKASSRTIAGRMASSPAAASCSIMSHHGGGRDS